MKSSKLDELPFDLKVDHSLTTTYKYSLYRKFIKAIKEYNLIQEDDSICVCISGGKDSMLMAMLFKHLVKYSDFPFNVTYIVMDPGYNDINRSLIENNLQLLKIPAKIIRTDIFDITNKDIKNPCYLCAKMRRGALYRIAESLHCNKIALGHHFDDVIETTLMSIINSGSFQTMLPKLHSDNYLNQELIRPLYFIRENDIINWAKLNQLKFINCACKLTNGLSKNELSSKRAETKKLIQELKKSYCPTVEENLFKASENCNLDMLLGFKKNGVKHSFLDTYNDESNKIKDEIIKNNKQANALEKATREHNPLIIEKEFKF